MSIFSKQIDIITKSIVELKENNLKAMKRKLSDLIVRNTDIDFGELENIEGLFFAARQYAEIVSKRQKRENLIDGLLQVYALVETSDTFIHGVLNLCIQHTSDDRCVSHPNKHLDQIVE